MVKSWRNAYAKFQNWMMVLAFFVIGVLAIAVMILETINSTQHDMVIAQVVTIFSVSLALMVLATVMMITEIIYQNEIKTFPVIGYFYRLTPILTIDQRTKFLSAVMKRQIVITSMVAFFWIIIGDTPRAEPLVYSVTLMSAYATYGLEKVKREVEVE